MTVARAITVIAMMALGNSAGQGASVPSGAATISVALEPLGGDAVTVVTQVVAFADVEGVAAVMVVRSGIAGQVVSTQSQALDLSARQVVIVARMTLSLAPGDRLEVEATFISGDQTVSTATVTSGAAR